MSVLLACARGESYIKEAILDHLEDLEDTYLGEEALTEFREGSEPAIPLDRLGDFRIIVEIQDEELVVLVVEVGHRRDIYRRRL